MASSRFKTPKTQFKLEEGVVDYFDRVSQTLQSGFGTEDEKGDPLTIFALICWFPGTQKTNTGNPGNQVN